MERLKTKLNEVSSDGAQRRVSSFTTSETARS